MRKSTIAAVMLFGLSPATLALDAEAGLNALQGTWSSGSGHIWTFNADGTWEQLNGGVAASSTFSVEERPANAIRVTSSTGTSYIFHFANSDTMLTVYTEGKEGAGITLFRK